MIVKKLSTFLVSNPVFEMDEISIIETLIEEKLNDQFSHVDEIPNEKYNLDEKSDFWLKHPDKLVRLQFIKLIAESRKSTLGLSEKELIWTVRFLQWSINEKMEFVPFVKKILKRINENNLLQKRQLKTLEKTLYFETMNKASEDLFNEFYAKFEKEKSEAERKIQSYINFFRGHLLTFLKLKIGLSAVHFQVQSSLQIISLVQDIIDEKMYGPLDDDLLKLVYECMLLNSYESNKEICFDILLKSKKDYLKGKVFETVRVAVELANSMRPIDGITSALMLRLAMVSSDFMEEVKKFEIIKNLEDIDDYGKTKKDLAVLIILIDALERQLQVADKSIVLAASKYSLFGPLYCIRTILSHVNLKGIQTEDLWKKVTKDLISICFRLSKAASEIVNNSSPEGHLPMDLDPQHLQDFLSPDSDLEVTPQMVLLCSWRSVKEISLLFGEITSKAPIETESSKGLITETEIEEIGEHFVKLLCETKHRGAFEQAHVGFTMLCARLWRLQNVQIKDLPKIWLRRLIIEISGLTHSNTKLCATRRSAGVPFMVQAIVTSEKDRKKDPATLSLHSVMKILIGLSQLKESEKVGLEIRQTILETELFKDAQGNEFNSDLKTDSLTVIKSHALNILRTLVKNAQLGDLIQDYIADCLISAVRSYDGISWTERNAATLLFSALVTRIFGVQRTRDHLKLSHHNKLTGYKFFKMYPKLLDFMLQELVHFTEGNCMSIKPAVQSVLLILSRLCPSQNSDISDAEWKMDEFIDLTSRCGESRVYKTRELAARALVQFLTEDNLDQVISKLLSTTLAMVSSFNAAHGYCLQIMEVIESGLLFNSKPPVNEFIYFFEQIHDDVLLNLEVTSPKPACYPLATVCINILHTLLQPETFSDKEIMNELREHPIKSLIFQTTERQLMSHVQECLKDRPGRQNYENTILSFYSQASVKPDYHGFFPYEGLYRQNYNHPLNNRCTEMLLNFKVSSLTDVHAYERQLISIACSLISEDSTKLLIDPDFRLMVYKFLYTWNINVNTLLSSKGAYRDIMVKTLEWALKLKDHKVFMSDGFFLVLKKALTTILQETDDYRKLQIMNFFHKGHIDDVFRVFVNNSWMGNSSLECRREISETIGCLYVDQLSAIKNNNFLNLMGLEYHWWTTVLHLLLDDDEQVRKNAAKIVCNIEPRGKEVCAERSLWDFFNKFGNTYCRSCPLAGTIVLFSWGVNLLQDENFEMDESDVFTKAHNYNFLDFEKLANHCVSTIENYCGYVTENEFVNYRKTYLFLQEECPLVKLDFPFKTFDELFHQFETHPVVTEELENLLDPIYDKKLLHHRIYKKFRELKTTTDNTVKLQNRRTSQKL